MPMIKNPTQLPQPDKLAAAHSAQLIAKIQQKIKHQGPIPFSQFMEQALYAPGFGYYAAGSHKFGKEGDFTTAPEMSELYSRSIARQLQQILENCPGDILEFGAGTGRMAASILLELEAYHHLPENYYILEVSADLKIRQQHTLKELTPHLLNRVKWLESLQGVTLNGVILGNEVVDAFPVHLFKRIKGSFQELYVNNEQATLSFELGEPQPAVAKYLESLNVDFPDDYESECNLNILPWVKSISQVLRKGVVLLIDYGFPRHEYYHPDRNRGTLMCHYQHHAHCNPLTHVGLQDITAHVDFTAVAEAALLAGLDVAGFTNQASFLLSCGMIDLLQKYPQKQYEKLTNEIKILTSPNEMGELFKVIALTKNFDFSLLGFSLRNSCEKL